MKLTDYMNEKMMEVDLNAQAPGEVLQILVSKMVASGLLKRGDDALRRLREREKVMSTGIGGGIAIPHARTPDVNCTLIALGRSPEGVPFNAVDSKPVKLVFLILGPPESSAEHVKVLARIARLVKQPDFIAQCATAQTVEDLMEIVVRHQGGRPSP